MPELGPHNPLNLPKDIPAPQDDGGARHLTGMRLPDVALAATDGTRVNLSMLCRPHDRLHLSAHRRARCAVARRLGHDPGARGCTPQSCGFRDHFAELKALGVGHVFGLSTQDTAYQQEAANRLHLPFPLLSDERLQFASALDLPT